MFKIFFSVLNLLLSFLFLTGPLLATNTHLSMVTDPEEKISPENSSTTKQALPLQAQLDRISGGTMVEYDFIHIATNEKRANIPLELQNSVARRIDGNTVVFTGIFEGLNLATFRGEQIQNLIALDISELAIKVLQQIREIVREEPSHTVALTKIQQFLTHQGHVFFGPIFEVAIQGEFEKDLQFAIFVRKNYPSFCDQYSENEKLALEGKQKWARKLAEVQKKIFNEKARSGDQIVDLLFTMQKLRLDPIIRDIDSKVSWLRDQQSYQLIRNIVLSGRFLIHRVNLVTPGVLDDFGTFLKENKLVIETLYLSNIGNFVSQADGLAFAKNIASLLFSQGRPVTSSNSNGRLPIVYALKKESIFQKVLVLTENAIVSKGIEGLEKLIHERMVAGVSPVPVKKQ